MAWSIAARAQQPPNPIVGVLDAGSAEGDADLIAGFQQSLSDAGYVDGQNVAIEYRWAHGQLRRIARYVNDHLRHPDRDDHEKAIALGLHGQLVIDELANFPMGRFNRCGGTGINFVRTKTQRRSSTPVPAAQGLLHRSVVRCLASAEMYLSSMIRTMLSKPKARRSARLR